MHAFRRDNVSSTLYTRTHMIIIRTITACFIGIAVGCAMPPSQVGERSTKTLAKESSPTRILFPQELKRIKIYSEVTLDKETLRKIYELVKTLDSYVHPVSVVIIKTHPEKHTGAYFGDRDRIEIPSSSFNNPEFENEGFIKLFHELGHAIRKRISLRPDQEANSALQAVYRNLVQEAGFDYWTSRLDFNVDTENSPYFSIFDESSYIPPHPSPYGHPYTSPVELYAGALTVLRFFPDEFIERFKNLSSEGKEDAVRAVVRSFIYVLLLTNQGSKDLEELLPQYKKILKAILAEKE